jgi:hypothetical protein
MDPIGTRAMLGDVDRDLRGSERATRHARGDLLPGRAERRVVLHGIDPKRVDAQPVGLALVLETHPAATDERHILVSEGERANRAFSEAGLEAARLARDDRVALLDHHRAALGLDDPGKGRDPQRQHFTVRQAHDLGIAFDQSGAAGQFDQVARREHARIGKA